MTSFLASIARRATHPGNRLVPKGMLSRAASEPEAEPEEEQARALHLGRETREESDEARPLRRRAEAKPAEEEEVSPTRRAVREREEVEDEPARSLRRARTGPLHVEENEPLQPLHRSAEVGPAEAEEERAAPMRRAANGTEEDEKDEPAQALHRAEAPPEPEETEGPPVARTRTLRRTDEEEVGDEVRTVRRVGETPPGPDEMEPAEQLRDEQEPSALTALRRDVSPVPVAAPETEAPISVLEPPASSFQDAASAPPSFERPVVQIDQLDVLIHEPAAQPRRAAAGNGRSIRARYLRRL